MFHGERVVLYDNGVGPSDGTGPVTSHLLSRKRGELQTCPGWLRFCVSLWTHRRALPLCLPTAEFKTRLMRFRAGIDGITAGFFITAPLTAHV